MTMKTTPRSDRETDTDTGDDDFHSNATTTATTTPMMMMISPVEYLQDERVLTLPVEITAVNDPPEIRLVPGSVLRLAEVSKYQRKISFLRVTLSYRVATWNDK